MQTNKFAITIQASITPPQGHGLMSNVIYMWVMSRAPIRPPIFILLLLFFKIIIFYLG
jgi:hypothetical protein